MIKFKKMVAIEPTKLLPEWDEKLKEFAEEAIFMKIFQLSPQSSLTVSVMQIV